MRKTLQRTTGPACLTLLVGVAFAQHTATSHQGHVDAGYRMTPMEPPKPMSGIGFSTVKITTKSAKAQAYFSQGLSLLHCFWDFEAYRAFKEAARLDPDAPMAYWGIIESIEQYPAMKDEKKADAEIIEKLMDRASEHEKFYLRAQQKRGDGQPYLDEYEAIAEKYPDDLDAQAFLALAMEHGYKADGSPKPGQLAARSILENILHAHPDNAAANHYLIHVVEAGPHPESALHAADVLAKLAPASGHMVHMPGHIYWKIGDQDRARASFLAGMKVEEDYMRREGVKVIDNWNYSHNLSYLIASDAEAGRYKEALTIAAKLDSLPAIPARAVAKPGYALREGSTTGRLQIRFRKWDDMAAHPVVIGDASLAGEPARAYRDGFQIYATGMSAIEKKNLGAAALESDKLDALQWRLHSAKLEAEENGSPAPVLGLLETYSLDLRGNLKCAEGHFDEGIALLQQAVDGQKDIGYQEPPNYGTPEQENLGYAYLQAGQFAKARAAFEEELKVRAKSGHALYGIALSYERAGDGAQARKAYAQFLEAWKNADADLQMMVHARAFR